MIPHHPISAEGVPPLSREGSGPTFDFDALPRAFGSFRVQASLGDGRFGPVFLAEEIDSNTQVVVRTFTEIPDGQRDIVVEALRALCDLPLDHRSVARPVAAGVQADVPYLVHAYLDGVPADEFLESHGPQPLSNLAPLITQAAAAIDFAAAAGVHHGALSLRDLIIGRNGAGVSGFGLLQALGHEVDSTSDVGALANLTLALAEPRDHALIRNAAAQNPATALVFAAALQQPTTLTVDDTPLRDVRDAPLPVDLADTPLHHGLLPDPIAASAVADLPLSIEQPDAQHAADFGSGAPVGSAPDALSVGPTRTDRDSIAAKTRRDEPALSRVEKSTPSDVERPPFAPQPVSMFASMSDSEAPAGPEAPRRRSAWISLAIAASLIVGLIGGFAGGYVVGAGRLAPSVATAVPPPTPTGTRGQVYTDDSSPQAVSEPQLNTGDATPKSQPVPPRPEPRAAAGAPSSAPSTAAPRSSQSPRSADAEPSRPAEPRGPAALFVDSHPSGAQVFVDGALVGRTPLLLNEVRPGEHRVRMAMPMRRPWSTSVDVVPGTRTRVAASLEEIQE